ncbi:hypothetical protein GYH30_039959 [Glycine max]|uniref:EF-hand domain-containing protein n=2 Tax=Glycine subgen. Soja TaxID=1462606 RepID=I1M9Z0_SOYBN|nr:hypothetical protein GYH30_039959 [Glycine max]RZB68878.1 Calcium-binding allergen Ole e 8 [Glycine soja]
MNKLETVFNHFDANGDDKISADELDSVLRSLRSGKTLTLTATASSASQSLPPFVALTPLPTVDLNDHNKNGLISVAGLHLALNHLGLKCSVDECRDMIKSIDADGDGYINFKEFKTMMMTSKNCSGATVIP